MPTLLPQSLGPAGIAARIPHALNMCLLHGLLGWSLDDIRCSINNQSDPAHPLRTASGLLSPVAIEYASQAMALHSALCAKAQSETQSEAQAESPVPSSGADAAPRAGYLASARSLECRVQHLHDLTGQLVVHAQRLMGDQGQAMYSFTLHSNQGQLLVQGRATVVLDGQPKSHA